MQAFAYQRKSILFKQRKDRVELFWLLAGNMSIRIREIIISVCLLACIVGLARAQDSEKIKQADPNDPAHKEVSAPNSAQPDDGQPGNTLAKAAEQYRAALSGLAALYEADVKKLTDKNADLKDLLAKGIISRREAERSDAALAEAEAKLESVRQQIASAQALQDRPGIGAGVALSWTSGNAMIDGLIRRYAGMYGVDAFLVYCVIKQESSFSSSAVSAKGAQGLMQLMPDTAARYGVRNPYDPEQNINAGIHYLKDLLQRFNGNLDLALAGYNAGEGRVIRGGNTVPAIPETQYYVRSISKRYATKTPGAKTPAAGARKTAKPKKDKGSSKSTAVQQTSQEN
jgi:soluble lytic murein transglycosylase-like protein